MKKIISGNVYDTATAKMIGSCDMSFGTAHGIKETLYHTRSGRYFLHGQGGSSSPYFDGKDNERITPCTLKQAKSWAEKRLPPETYMNWFDISDDADTNRIATTITLAASTIAKLREIKAETGKPYGIIIDELVGDLK